jgi:medium-chain acyl-[acyl-carrier-protein] hydrolase
MSSIVEEPFAFFGHSLGAIVAFELARNIRRVFNREPEVLCVSGRRAPQIPSNKPARYDLPKDEFIEELRRIDGTPSEVLEHEELMELVLPLLRADFQLIETYEYREDAPLGCPIVAYAGRSDDEASEELMSGWRSQTTSDFALHVVPGDHFFLRASQTRLLALLSQRFREYLALGRMNKTRAGEAAM